MEPNGYEFITVRRSQQAADAGAQASGGGEQSATTEQVIAGAAQSTGFAQIFR